MHRFCLFAIALFLFSFCADGQVCSSESSWSGFQKTCEKCFALVQTSQSTCKAYCASLPGGHYCADAAEDSEGNLCSPRITTLPGTNTRITCDTDLKTAFAGTSDILCKCVTSNVATSPTAPSPKPTPRPTPKSSGASGATFGKPSGSKLRIVAYNVMRSSVFPANLANGQKIRTDGFKRMAKAVKADIWALQEMFYGVTKTTSDANAIATYMKGITGDTWFVSGDWSTSNPGEFLLSRFRIKWSKEVGRRTYASLIDLSSIGQRDILVLNVHFMKDDHGAETGNYISKVLSGGESSVPKDTPIVVAGDYNAGYASTRYNYIKTKGFSDAYPVQLDASFENTKGWSTRTSASAPWTSYGGRIDHFLYKQQAGLPITNQYILNSFVINQGTLTSNGMTFLDCALEPSSCTSTATTCETDHMPIVTDFGGSSSFKPRVAAYGEPEEVDTYGDECCDEQDKIDGEPDGPLEELIGGAASLGSTSIYASMLLLLGFQAFYIWAW